jgi:uncharacterized protein
MKNSASTLLFEVIKKAANTLLPSTKCPIDVLGILFLKKALGQAFTISSFGSRYLVILILLIFLYPLHSKNTEGTNDTMQIRLGKTTIIAEIADTPKRRSLGLMFRKKLNENSGMLFIFPKEDYLSFWMKNTLIPLSIGYFDRDGVLLEVYEMKPNQTEEVYNSRKKAIYALEMNSGWFTKNNINPGAVLIMEKSVIGR